MDGLFRIDHKRHRIAIVNVPCADDDFSLDSLSKLERPSSIIEMQGMSFHFYIVNAISECLADMSCKFDATNCHVEDTWTSHYNESQIKDNACIFRSVVIPVWMPNRDMPAME
jgi:hypothetical protein